MAKSGWYKESARHSLAAKGVPTGRKSRGKIYRCINRMDFKPIPMGLTRSINNLKDKLIEKARKSGIYENFGQNEVKYLKDKYDYSSLQYGSPKQREYAKKIDDFERWASTYSIKSFKYGGTTYRQYF